MSRISFNRKRAKLKQLLGIRGRLVLLEKDSSGRVASRDLLPVRFVPLLRGER